MQSTLNNPSIPKEHSGERRPAVASRLRADGTTAFLRFGNQQPARSALNNFRKPRKTFSGPDTFNIL
jgi:hypothetical protein